MKKLIAITAALATLAVSATAEALTPYVEGQLGIARLDDVNPNPYSEILGYDVYNGNLLSITKTTIRDKREYDSSATFGAEFGFKDVIVPNLRIGASISTMKFDLKSVQIDAVITLGSFGVIDTLTGTSNKDSVGSLFYNRVNLYMLNAYYDFKTSTAFTPFVGFGIGLADIKNAKDNEFAYSVNAGAKYNIDKNVYVGAKGAYTRVNGPTDQLGIKYQDIDVYSANLSIGYEF